jgi:hypothetical protein
MKMKAEESNGFERPHITEGLHHAVFLNISDAPDGKFGARVALDFAVYYSKTQRPVKIGRVFGKKLTPKSQLWEALEAIGADIEVGKEIDINTLVGRKCRVMIEDYKDNEGKTVSGISKVKSMGEDTQEFILQTDEYLSLLDEPAKEETKDIRTL